MHEQTDREGRVDRLRIEQVRGLLVELNQTSSFFVCLVFDGASLVKLEEGSRVYLP